jgi:hypothetical protein
MALKGVWRRTTVLDRLVVLSVALGCLASFALLERVGAGQRVVVVQGGKTLFVAPLDSKRTVSLPGPLGETRLAIDEGTVCVLNSPCPHKICMGSGSVSRAGELLACVPNRLLIRIEGEAREEGNDYDLLSR